MGHVISRANGGDNTVDNLRVVCSECNTNCGTMNLDEYRQINLPYIRSMRKDDNQIKSILLINTPSFFVEKNSDNSNNEHEQKKLFDILEKLSKLCAKKFT
jgi:hypothetical protein